MNLSGLSSNAIATKIDEATLEGQIELLHSAISTLEESGAMLEKRIGNVLLPEIACPPNPNKESVPEAMCSVLTSRVKEAIRRVRVANKALYNLTERVNS